MRDHRPPSSDVIVCVSVSAFVVKVYREVIIHSFSSPFFVVYFYWFRNVPSTHLRTTTASLNQFTHSFSVFHGLFFSAGQYSNDSLNGNILHVSIRLININIEFYRLLWLPEIPFSLITFAWPARHFNTNHLLPPNSVCPRTASMMVMGGEPKWKTTREAK